jgi:hydroxypyruvate reductase
MVVKPLGEFSCRQGADREEHVSGKARVLQVGPLPDAAVALLGEHFALVTAEVGAEVAGIRAVATSGKQAIDGRLLDRLPDLAIVSCLGAGTDGIDLQELARRDIAVATTANVLAADVADVAIGLIIALARDFRRADRFVREGRWQIGKHPLGHALSGTRLGILGLGTIGSAVARRAGAFGMEIGYHNRAPRGDIGARYFPTLVDLAEWCRFLVVCCPGGRATHNLVDAQVLGALGPGAWLINVARGSVVDEPALVAALEGGRLAGAGLDVFAVEPTPHPGLLALNNVILLPHIGSATVETRDAMARAMVGALIDALAPG